MAAASSYRVLQEPPDFDRLTLTQKLAVDRLCDQFEQEIRRGSGPRFDDYLGRMPENACAALFRQLLAVQFELTIASDRQAFLADLLRRFPQYADDIEAEAHRKCMTSGGTARTQTKLETSKSTSPQFANDNASDDEHLPSRIGRYEIVRILGEGGFGRVYLAMDSQLGRQVAIKTPRRELFGSAQAREMFLQEARSAARLQHPGIVTLHDVGMDGDTIFIVQEYISGHSLAARMVACEMPLRHRVELMASIVDSVAFAHQNGMTHRDLKPANILVDDWDQPHLVDFGLALQEDLEQRLRGQRCGTPAYMSPEQVRGKTHRIDCRSDIWSLGVVFYELLAGQLPFLGASQSELFTAILHNEPVALRELAPHVAPEIERICLKCLSKRIFDRYDSADLLAEDLRLWLTAAEDRQRRNELDHSPCIIPRGLRSFGVDDAEYFLHLLPGPRDRDGLPESIAFWKYRIEVNSADTSFPIGLVYGPSGCGKSSLVKAGLIPRLARHVRTIVVEATADGTLDDLHGKLKRHFAEIPEDVTLADVLQGLREGLWCPPNQKILLVIDQFEQWLHAHRSQADSRLSSALRQCDGSRLQCLLLVRDDFWVAANRFAQSIDVKFVERENQLLVEQFDPAHARMVLANLGRAFGRLPVDLREISVDQQAFLDRAIEGLTEDGRIVCIKLTLLASMLKGKPWSVANWKVLGGIEGLGVIFLDEIFSGPSAPAANRQVAVFAQNILMELLPELGTNIIGGRRSDAELRQAASCDSHTFNETIRILDQELKLISPSDNEPVHEAGGVAQADRREQIHYQLSHDFFVPALREWLSRKQKQTLRGRAKLRLKELAGLWNSKHETRYLPPWWECLGIRCLTKPRTWTTVERSMMASAGKLHGWRAALILVSLAILASLGYEASGRYRARELVAQIPMTDMADLPSVLRQAKQYARWVVPILGKRIQQAEENSSERLKLSLALVDSDVRQVDYLFNQLLQAESDEFPVIRRFLQNYVEFLVERLWRVASGDEPDQKLRRLRAAAALADYDRASPRWAGILPDVTRELVSVDDSSLRDWRDALRPVAKQLIDPLVAIWRDAEQTEVARSLALDVLLNYVPDDASTLVDLALESEANAFNKIFPLLRRHGNTALHELRAVLQQRLEPVWDDSAIDRAWSMPDASIISLVTAAHGQLEQESAYFQDLAWSDWPNVEQAMRKSHFRLTRFRPFSDGVQLRIAAVWTRDDRNWLLETERLATELPKNGLPAENNGLVPADIAAYDNLADTGGEPLYSVVWSTPAENEKRVIFAGPVGQKHDALTNTFNEKRSLHRCSFQICLEANGRTRVSTIWSNQGAPSMFRANHGGWERIDLPQWDVALWNVYSVAAPANGQSRPSVAIDPNQYAGVWREDPHYESKLILGVTPQELESRGRELARQGFRPFSISVASGRSASPVSREEAHPELRAAAVWHRPTIPNALKERLAKRQSVAAVALLRWGLADLGELAPHSREASQLIEQATTEIWPIFKFQPDPTLRSLLINRLVSFGADPNLIIERFHVEQDISARRAIILALGDFAWARLIPSNHADDLKRELLSTYRDDSDPGIHGAAEWTLNHLGAKQEMDEIRKELATGSQVDQRQWYISQHNDHTMIVCNPSGPFVMGSPVTEPSRRTEHAQHKENLRRVLIPRRFAIAQFETTVVQYNNSNTTLRSYSQFKDLTDSPITYLSWYRARAYCNWLSKMEGIPESEWCYPPPTTNPASLNLRPEYLYRTGYRLLTEAEWEFACRAGTSSARYCGDSNELMRYYGATKFTRTLNRDLPLAVNWERVPREPLLPVGLFKPNDYGLFDMLGNASEWCYDRLLRYPLEKIVYEDVAQTSKFDPVHERVIRGESYRDPEAYMRSAARKGWEPGEIQQSLGFRIGRTMPD